MSGPDRIDEILDLLGQAWKQEPDLRFGQLVSGLVNGQTFELFYLEDELIAMTLGEKVRP